MLTLPECCAEVSSKIEAVRSRTLESTLVFTEAYERFAPHTYRPNFTTNSALELCLRSDAPPTTLLAALVGGVFELDLSESDGIPVS